MAATRTVKQASTSEFFSVEKGEILSVLQELPDGTFVVRRGDTDEEGLVPHTVFAPTDDLSAVENSDLFVPK